jgi:hypothetical protein
MRAYLIVLNSIETIIHFLFFTVYCKKREEIEHHEIEEIELERI